jgi:4-alpha-glucanotransferase
MRRRGSGILLHISSLPAPYGIGDLGPQACQFADFLAQTRQNFWQILPLTPTELAAGSSPYHSRSAFAGNSLLISPELLVREGLLTEAEASPSPNPDHTRVDFPSVVSYKMGIFERAFERFQTRRPASDYEQFCSRQSYWLEDYSRFAAFHAHFGGKVWSDWPAEIRDRHPEALKKLDQGLSLQKEREKFLQFIFYRQWKALKEYCNQRGIQIIGDIPIYLQYDSADLWVHPEIFKLDQHKKPTVVAGVPPDYFSKTGQLWGNPIYHWDALRQTGYAWWLERMDHNRSRYDVLRIDHFLGLVAYWEVPAGEETAVNGVWVEAQGEDFLKALFKKFPFFNLIAEDLGSVTPAVREIIRRFDIPGMKVLLFAFGDDLSGNPYVPHNHIPNCILYTGTHDNNTVRGWFESEATPEDKGRLFRYLGRAVSAEEVSGEFIRLAMMSVADVVLLPIQDLLGLGAESRMNTPSTSEGNWQWKLFPGQLTPEHSERLREMTEIYGRA